MVVQPVTLDKVKQAILDTFSNAKERQYSYRLRVTQERAWSQMSSNTPRIIRGSGWHIVGASQFYTAFRGRASYNIAFYTVGFRCVFKLRSQAQMSTKTCFTIVGGTWSYSVKTNFKIQSNSFLEPDFRYYLVGLRCISRQR